MKPEKSAKVTHSDAQLFDRKLHAIRGKTVHAQKFRTAEVTICIIPEGLLDRSRQFRTSGNRGCRRQRLRCHCPGYRMFSIVDDHDVRIEPI